MAQLTSDIRYALRRTDGLLERRLGPLHLILREEREHPEVLAPLSRGILILLGYGPLGFEEIITDLQAAIPDIEVAASTLERALEDLVDLGLARIVHDQ